MKETKVPVRVAQVGVSGEYRSGTRGRAYGG